MRIFEDGGIALLNNRRQVLPLWLFVDLFKHGVELLVRVEIAEL